ncbi:hypothetical protein D6C85_08187 [Aureobasidium pullulans]|nr:hypothetical protein D6C89_03429 [Aureobasidium pullulans]THZ66366.1 hypothetical protein D6C85_08187 [Aureobasidium pullulans]THZ94384.1 hypothetical protein D6C82_08331 [Aureobasidium pullulans]
MAPLTSSAINKGKKFAPKAAVARRRPAAQPAPKPATPAEPTLSSTSDTVTGTSQADTTSTQPDRQQAPTAPLPTPPATQQSPVTQPPTAAAAAAQQPSRQPTPPPPAALPHHLEPSPLSLAQSDNPLRQSAPSAASVAQTPPSSQVPIASTPPPTQSVVQLPESITNDASSYPEQSANTAPSSPNQLAGQKRKRPTPPPSAPSQEVAAPQPSQSTVLQPAPTLESNTEAALINTLIEHQEQPRAPVAQMLPPVNSPATASKPRAKRQRRTAATQLSDATGDDSQAAGGAQENDAGPTPVAKPKKPRAPRAKRAPKSAATVVEDDNGNIVETEEPAPRPVPKPRKPRQKKKQSQVEGEGGDTGQDDPVDDPENHEVDVAETTMFELTKDRGLGKVSERETKMAAIDWDEVHRKRVAEAEAIRSGIDPATLNAQPTENNEGGEGGEGENTNDTPRPPRPPPVVTGPRLRLDAEGNLVVEEDSLRIDRQAQAARNAENLVVTENDDLTKRVNQMSWINERRRDPTDRVPFFKMKSDPWSDEETDRFYDALRMFGTDFFIISKMFQPKTRRQIKLKFIREEKLDPDRINRVLAGESSVPMNLESFAEATGQELGGFKDPRELEEELRVEGEEQRVEIARKKKEMEEAKEQRDIQMAAREKDQEERAAQKREKAAMRQNKRRGIFGTGTF